MDEETMSDDTQELSGAALNILFRKARSFDAFAPDAVTDEQLRAIHDIMKHGPTTSNSQPQRIVFPRSAEAKQRLAPALSNANRGKTLAAPVDRSRVSQALGAWAAHSCASGNLSTSTGGRISYDVDSLTRSHRRMDASWTNAR
jgi:nitroreductase